LLALVAGLWLTRRAPRTDRTRAALIIWGGWLLVTAVVFSFASGVIHTYYTVALVPATTALIAVTGAELWRTRQTWTSRIFAAAMVGLAVGWSVALLDRDASWHPALRGLIIAAGIVAVCGILGYELVRTRLAAALRPAAARAAGVAVLLLALIGGLGGAAAYAAQTITVAHTGSIPTAGPASSSGFGFGGGGGGFGGGTRPGGSTGGTGTAPSGGTAPSFGGGTAPTGASGTAPTGGFGTATANSALSKLLAKTTTKWSAATVGAQSAGALELSSGTAIMALGGFTGSDPSLTLAQFKADVAKGEIHYFIAGGSGFGGGSSDSSQITSWVTSHFKATTVGGETVYNLLATPSS
jgi:4-amino-4-deoxy-L-arabinose transferase-like glycosyltransferase